MTIQTILEEVFNNLQLTKVLAFAGIALNLLILGFMFIQFCIHVYWKYKKDE